MKKLPKSKHWKVLAKDLLSDTDNHLHSINDYVIHHYNNYYRVINRQSLKIIEFNEEQKALDYCLDFYKSSINKQLDL